MIAVINDKKLLSFANSRNNTKGNYRQKSSKWQRRPPLNTNHPKYTLEFFMANPFFHLLGLENQIFALMFWTTRYCHHSLRELEVDLSKDLNRKIYRQTLIPLFKKWESQGFVIKHLQYRSNKQGKETKSFKRNYYELTSKGKDFMKIIIFFARFGEIPEGAEIPVLKICGTVVKTPRNFMFRDWNSIDQEHTLTNEYFKKDYHHNNFSEKEKKSQGEWEFSFELIEKNSKWFFLVKCSFNSDPPKKEKLPDLTVFLPQKPKQSYPHPWFNGQETFKNAKLFEKFDYGEQYEESNFISKKFWAKQEPKLIEKVLKQYGKKKEKGLRIQSFERFFSHLVRSEGKSFFKFKAEKMRDAVEGNITAIALGFDSQAVAELIRELEKNTGQKIDEKTMIRLMRQPTQKLRKALEAVNYRVSGKTSPTKKQANTGQKKPIYGERVVKEQISVYNPKTGKEEVREVKKRIKTIVGYEEPKQEQKPLRKYVPVKSWIGMLMFALKMDSIEEINDKFFKKRDENG
uniref:Uncharacterized protein n=1 Tax=Candidatus Kentrum sp. SD TaxID=2126332 RepID=A0A451BQW9_9GAMM|nr:MAG: hypothetical protein BECKSD772D_GA0070982_11402 [Candidatus Kentron sp. SD]